MTSPVSDGFDRCGTGDQQPIEISASPDFTNWLDEQRVSLAFTTYDASRLFLIGLESDGRISCVERPLTRCMGLTAANGSLWASTLYQVMHFVTIENVISLVEGYDRVYAPRVGYVTGDLDIHDMSVDGSGRLVFASTLFSCLATVDGIKSFRPIWKPPFITKLAPEDRCHLNGLAVREGRLAWVTAVAESNVREGWRGRRVDGGCVIDVAANEVVVRGLSMPHSPRWYRDRLWLHQLGTGEFGFINLRQGTFDPVCFCPGYLRGLDFAGDFALVGLSLPRDGRTFQGLPVERKLSRNGNEARCAIQVVDLRSGESVHSLRVEGGVKELYDVVVLPGVRRPSMTGFDRSEMRRAVSAGEWDEPFPR